MKGAMKVSLMTVALLAVIGYFLLNGGALSTTGGAVGGQCAATTGNICSTGKGTINYNVWLDKNPGSAQFASGITVEAVEGDPKTGATLLDSGSSTGSATGTPATLTSTACGKTGQLVAFPSGAIDKGTNGAYKGFDLCKQSITEVVSIATSNKTVPFLYGMNINNINFSGSAGVSGTNYGAQPAAGYRNLSTNATALGAGGTHQLKIQLNTNGSISTCYGSPLDTETLVAVAYPTSASSKFNTATALSITGGTVVPCPADVLRGVGGVGECISLPQYCPYKDGQFVKTYDVTLKADNGDPTEVDSPTLYFVQKDFYTDLDGKVKFGSYNSAGSTPSNFESRVTATIVVT